MDLIIIDKIPLKIEPAALMQKLRLEEGDPQAGDAFSLLEQALEIGRPKACFRLVEVESAGEDFVVLGGRKLTSRVLRVNLEKASGQVAAFVATCGQELERWAESHDDFLLRFYAEEICECALRCAADTMNEQIAGRLGAEKKKLSSMNPGSLEDWPLFQQQQLFSVVGQVTAAIGVELTESFLMRPRKSISGIRFASHQEFVNCKLCNRENCQGRRADFDPHLFEITYAGAKQGEASEHACAECVEED